MLQISSFIACSVSVATSCTGGSVTFVAANSWKEIDSLANDCLFSCFFTGEFIVEDFLSAEPYGCAELN